MACGIWTRSSLPLVRGDESRIDLAKHIQDISQRAGKSEDTKIKDIRTTRRREQRKRHMDFVKGDVGNE